MVNEYTSFPEEIDNRLFFSDLSIEQKEAHDIYVKLINDGDYTMANAFIESRIYNGKVYNVPNSIKSKLLNHFDDRVYEIENIVGELDKVKLHKYGENPLKKSNSIWISEEDFDDSEENFDFSLDRGDLCLKAGRYYVNEDGTLPFDVNVTRKNLIEYPYSDNINETINGITWTVDISDGSIKANGTATADSIYYLKTINKRDEFSSYTIENEINNLSELSLKKGGYILSGCPQGGSESTYGLYADYGYPLNYIPKVIIYDNNSYGYKFVESKPLKLGNYAKDFGNNCVFVVTEKDDYNNLFNEKSNKFISKNVNFVNYKGGNFNTDNKISFSYNNSFSKNYIEYCFDYIEAGTYNISLSSTYSNTQINVYTLNNNSKSLISSSNSELNPNVSFVLTENYNNIVFEFCFNNLSGSNIYEIKDIMFVNCDNKHDYFPYVISNYITYPFPNGDIFGNNGIKYKHLKNDTVYVYGNTSTTTSVDYLTRYITLEPGKYFLSGGNAKCNLSIYDKNGNILNTDNGQGAYLLIDKNEEIQIRLVIKSNSSVDNVIKPILKRVYEEDYHIDLYCKICKGQTVNNLIFKPTIEESIDYATFIPFSKSHMINDFTLELSNAPNNYFEETVGNMYCFHIYNGMLYCEELDSGETIFKFKINNGGDLNLTAGYFFTEEDPLYMDNNPIEEGESGTFLRLLPFEPEITSDGDFLIKNCPDDYFKKLGGEPFFEIIDGNIIGDLNYIPYPYEDSKTVTRNGITFTETNGRIVVNGTATADTYYMLLDHNSVKNITKLNNKYKLKGCPNLNSNSIALQLFEYEKDNTTLAGAYFDNGNGVEFKSKKHSYTSVNIVIRKGTTINNETFVPILCEK